jgi:hypothetical protein
MSSNIERFEEIEKLIDELDLPIRFPDLLQQVHDWDPIDDIDRAFRPLTGETAFLEAAVAIQLRLLELKQGLDVERVMKFLKLVTILPQHGFACGASSPTGEVC